MTNIGSGIAVRCDAVTKTYGDEMGVHDLDLAVRLGEVHALVGFNGAGKTTLMRLMLGMAQPDQGAINVLGADVVSARSSVWRRVGHMVETPFVYPELTVRENLTTAALLHGVSHHRAKQAVTGIIERLGLGPWADRRARTLSLGNRQRVGLASALLHEPELLVLDEPTSALDPAGVVLLRDILQQVAASGTAVLISSHHLDEVSRVAVTVTVLHGGSVVGELDPQGTDLERAFFSMVYDADTHRDSTGALGTSR